MDKELLEKLREIEAKVDACKSESEDKGHTLLLIMVFIIFLRGCS